MNVLFVTHKRCTPTAGGVEHITFDLSREMMRHQHHVEFLYTNRQEVQEANEHCMPAVQAYQYDERCERYYQNLQRRLKIEVIIVQLAVTDRRHFFFEKALIGVRTIACVHCSALHRMFPNYSKEQGWKYSVWRVLWKISPSVAKFVTLCLLKREYRWLASNAYKIVVLREDYQRQVEELFGVKTMVIPDFFAYEQPEPIPMQAKEKIVLQVGRIHQQSKNPLLFVRSWQRLCESHQDWRAVMIGGGSDWQIVQDYIKENNVPRIELLPEQDPCDYYRRSAMVCLTSPQESFGLALLEGATYSCATVSYDGALVTQRVKSYDEQGYQEAIAHLMDDSDRLQAQQQKAWERSKKFQCERIYQRWEALLARPKKVSDK